jgi:hypothetical protein
MSTLKVNYLVNINDNGPPTFTQGIVVSAGYALTCNGGVNIAGVVTATSFSGNGSGLTNLAVVSPSKLIALQFILNPLPYYRH